MGNVIQESDLTGRRFSFKIAGDEPTVDEQQRIDAIIRQNDTEFAKEYESEYGVSATPGEGSGILNTLGELGKGTGRGAVNLLESAGLGAAALLPEEQELPVREFIRSLGYSARSGLQPDLGVEDMMIGEEAGKFGEALGSFAPLAATAFIPGVGVPIAGGLAMGAGAGEASERARAAGASQEDRNKAALLGAGVGISEILPIKFGPLAKTLEQTGSLGRLKRIFAAGGLEALQEAAANTAQNLIEQGYNPERGTFEGSGESAAYGGGVGGLVQGIIDLVIPGRFSKKTSIGEADTVEKTGVDDDYGEGPFPVVGRFESSSRDENLPMVVDEKLPATIEQQPIVATPEEALGLEGPEERLGLPAPAPVEEGEETDGTKLLTVDTGTGTGDGSGGSSVAGGAGVGRRAKSAKGAVSPNDGSVGRGVPDIDVAAISTGNVRNPLALTDAEIEALFKEEIEPTSGAVGTGVPKAKMNEDALASGVENTVTRSAVDLVNKGFGNFTQDELLDVARRNGIIAGKGTGMMPAQVFAELSDRVKSATKIVTDLPQSDTRLPINLQNVRETDVEKVESIYATEQRNATVARYQDFRNKNPDMAIYHDEFVLDKDSDKDILTGKDLAAVNGLFIKQARGNKLTAEEQAAIDYFERFERPEHAIEEIAARTELDVDDAVPGERAISLLPETDQDRMAIATTASAFLEPFNKDAAELAGSWINTNMSPQVKEAYESEKASAAERATVARRQKFKAPKLLDVKPRPKGKGAKAQIAQAEWDASFKDSYLATGKPKPTMSEQVAEGAQEIEADANKAFNDQLDAAAAAQARSPTIETLPEELTKPLSEVGPEVREIDRLDSEQQEIVTSPEGTRADDEAAREIMQDADFSVVGALYGNNFDPDHRRLFTQFMVEQSKPVDPVTMTMLEDNNLADALREYAKTASPATRMWARTLAKYAGNTEVRFADKSTQIAGFFVPRENAIVFNTNVPVTGHLLLHEVAHAATSTFIANNPNAAPVKTLRKIYQYTDGAFDSAYNFEEFVAEAISNKDVRTTLHELLDTKQYASAYTRFVEAIRRIFQQIRFELGGKPPEQKSILEMVDPLLYKILSPAPNFRDAAPLFQMGHNPEAVNQLFRDTVNSGNTFDPETAFKTFEAASKKTWKDSGVNFMTGTLVRGGLQALSLHSVVRLGELAGSPSAPKINTLVNQSMGELDLKLRKVQQANDKSIAWANKASDADLRRLNRLNLQSSAYQVDPAIPPQEAREKYSDEAFSVYRKLRADYETAQRNNPEIVEIHHQSRNMFKGLYRDFIEATDERLAASGVSEEVRNQIRSTFYANMVGSGELEVYIPLNREPGDYWLSLNAIDPVTGVMERYTDSFQGVDARARAMESIVADAKENLRVAPAESQAGRLRDSTAASYRRDGMTEEQALDRAMDDMLEVEATEKIDILNFQRTAPDASFVSDIMGAINNDPNVDDATKQELGEIILNTLPQTSYLQSFRKRKGGEIIRARMGYNEDSVKVISERATSLARQVVNLKYKSRMQRELANIQKELNESNETTREFRTAIMSSLKSTVEDGPMPIRGKASRLATSIGFNMTLGANISGGVVNLGQIGFVTYPYLAAKYGPFRIARAMKASTALGLNSGRTQKIKSYAIDASDVDMDTQVGSAMGLENHDVDNLSPKAQRILDNIGMSAQEFKVLQEVAEDLGQFKRSLDHEILDVDNMTSFYSKFNKWSGFFQHHSERINRQTSLFAAYYGALGKMSSEERANSDNLIKAAQEAVYDTETANGGMAAAAAPKLARNSVGAVVFMYKRYGVAMISMLTQLAYRAAKGSPAERRVAMAQLAGIFGAAGLMAGVHGMPGFGMVTTAMDVAMRLLGMDPGGEDDDAKTMVRAYLGEPYYKGLINYFTGVNVASRIGLSELIYRESVIDRDYPLPFQVLEQFGGPLVGITLNSTRGLGQIHTGIVEGDMTQFSRGLETISPATIKNMQKAARFYREGGAYTMDGKPIVKDFSTGHLMGQFFGFSPTRYSVQMENNRLIKRKDKAQRKRRQGVYDMFARAYYDGDSDGMRRAIQRMTEYNRLYPQTPILLNNLMQSIRRRNKNRSTAYHGLTLNPKHRASLIREAERFGDPVFSF